MDVSDEHFQLLTEMIHREFGIVIGAKKKSLLEYRLRKILQAENLDSIEVLLERYQGERQREFLSILADHVSTNYTFFNREPDHFEYFKNTLLPYFSTHIEDRDLRIWCGASSSGEEPYMLAMILRDFFGRNYDSWQLGLLATDISLDALQKAQRGIYEAKDLKAVSPAWIQQYFEALPDGLYQFKREFSKDIIFRRFNLMKPQYAFKKRFHIVFLRNVMIYFDVPTKKNVIEKVKAQLQVGGYLFVGMSETLGDFHQGFTMVRPSIYQRVG